MKLEGDFDVATENKTQFVEKPASKSALKKVGTNLQLEGKIDLNPEYKNAYVNFYKDAYGKFGVVKDQNSQRIRRQHLKSDSGPTDVMKAVAERLKLQQQIDEEGLDDEEDEEEYENELGEEEEEPEKTKSFWEKIKSMFSSGSKE